MHRYLIAILSCLILLRTDTVQAQELPATPAAEPTMTPIPLIAERGVHFIVSPPVLDLRTEPGSSASATIKIKNNNTEKEALRIDLAKFSADQTGSKPVLQELGPNDEFPRWLTFSETQFVMEPRTWKSINVTFSPPANAAPAYYFAIMFNRQNDPEVKMGAVAHGAAAILTLVQVNSSRVYHQLNLMQLGDGFNFKTDKYIYEFLPANFEVTLQNSGNVHEVAWGNIFIDWLSGNKQDVGILNVNADKSRILPQSQRTFTSTWTDGFPVWVEEKDAAGESIKNKDGSIKKRLQWDLSKLTSFRIGKYRALLVMAYNDGVRDIPLEAEAEFWVIPWRILLALLVILIIIGFGLKGMIQSVWKKYKEARTYARYRSKLKK